MLFWVLTVEVGLGCLCFGTRMFRRSAALYIALLHVFYILIGNFGTYHWNALLLCITLLDDQLFPRVTRMLRRVLARVARGNTTSKDDPSTRGKARFSSNTSWHVWHTRVAAVVALALVILSIVPISVVTHQFVPAPAVVVDMYRLTYPFKMVNIYGPFHRVHKERQELIVQGSSDAQHWYDYDNRYKPDRFVKRMPAFVSPHISRVRVRPLFLLCVGVFAWLRGGNDMRCHGLCHSVYLGYWQNGADNDLMEPGGASPVASSVLRVPA